MSFEDLNGWTCSQAAQDAFIALHLLGQVLCLASNGSILVVILRTNHLHMPNSLLVVTLAFSDICLSLVWNVTALTHASAEELDSENGSHSDDDAGSGLGGVLEENNAACVTVGFLWQTLLSASTLYQAAIACDRYLFIAHPLRYEVFITRAKVAVVLVVLGLLAVVLPTTTLLGGGAYVYLPPAMTCVSNTTWYVLFVALVFLPSFAVTLASSLGIWSLCVRQLNTPGRARLVREVHPVTHAFNLQKKNGRVAVRRDIVDEFSWYSPALCCRGKLSTGGEADSSGCLQHLVQNSSLMFVEGFIAAVPTSPVSETQPSESDCCESAAPATSTGPLLPTLLLQSPLQRRVPADDAGEAKSLAKPGNSLSEKNGKTSLAMHLIRTCSNPESDVNLLTPGSSNKPVSSPSSLSTRSSRSHLFRRTPSSFLTTQDLADSSCVPKQGGGGGGGSGAGAAEDQQGEVGRLLSPGVCPILSNNLSLETFDMLELSMQAVAGGNLQVASLSASNYPSTSSLRSMLSDCQGSFRSNLANSSAGARRTAESDSSQTTAGVETESPVPFSAVVNPIFGWVFKAKQNHGHLGDKRGACHNAVSSQLGTLSLSLGIDLGRTATEENNTGSEDRQEEDDLMKHVCDVVADNTAPLRRRAKAAVLVALPVVSMVLTVLPLVGVMTRWVVGGSISGETTAWICHVVYFVLPSLNPFLVGLTNRQLRHALSDTLCHRLNN